MSANEIRIEEIGGANPVRVTLRSRAMPYRGMETGGEQRTKLTWYQGNPKATQQILGSIVDPTTITGMWKSKFVTVGRTGDGDVDIEVENDDVALGVTGGVDFTQGKVTFENPASAAVGIFERLRDRGKELRFQWGEVIRYGVLKSFLPTWDRYEDVAWSATFEWNGTTQRAPRRAGQVTTFGQPVQSGLTKADDSLVAMPRIVDTPIRNQILGRMAELRARSLDLLTYSRAASSAITVPLRIVQGAAGIVATAEQVSTEIVSDCMSVPYEAFTTSDSVVDVLRTEVFRRDLGIEVDSLRARSVEERNRLQALSVDLGDATRVRVQQRASLRSIAAQHYGSPDDWTLIAEANGLNSSIVEEGTLLFIPVQTTSTNSEAP